MAADSYAEDKPARKSDKASDSLKAQHDEALERFNLAVSVEEPQRKREEEALKFQTGDQWPSEVKAARSGSPSNAGTGQPSVPARPMLTIRSLDQSIGQIVNQARNARLAITVAPKGDGASQENAQIFEDMIREIEYQSQAQDAYLWAYQRMVPAGRGNWRVDKEYELEDPDPSDLARYDQVIRIRRNLNQACVYKDPFAQQRGGADAEWAFVTEDIPCDRYKREYPKTKLAQMADDDATFTARMDELKHWIIQGDKDVGSCYRVAEYWCLTYEESEMVEDSEEGRAPRSRTIRKPKLMWAKMNGVEFIDEPQEWDGRLIPLAEIVGNEYNIGGLRIFEGVVKPAMDSCRMLNYMVTASAEQIGLTSRPKYVGYAGQFEGFEDQWDQSAARNLTKLEAHGITDATGGQLLPLPHLEAVEAPIQAMSQMIGQFTNFIRSTTGVPDAALGFINPNDKSGKAIRALQEASEQGTSNYLDGLAKGIEYTGRVLVDLIPSVYDRPGRKIQIRSSDGKLSAILLNVPYVNVNGKPMPVPQEYWRRDKDGDPEMVKPLPPGPNGQPLEVKYHDLSRGKYSVVVEVGKSFATQREASNAQLSALAQTAPELVPRFADLWVEEMDLKKGKAIADRLKPPGTDDENVPPQVKAAISGMQQQLQQAHQIIQTKTVEKQFDIQKAQIEADKDIKLQQMKDATSIAVAKINAMAKGVMAAGEDMNEALALGEQMQHEAQMAAADRAHDVALAHVQHQQGMQQQDAAHQQALAQGQQQAGQQQDLAVTNAALQPPAPPQEAGA